MNAPSEILFLVELSQLGDLFALLNVLHHRFLDVVDIPISLVLFIS